MLLKNGTCNQDVAKLQILLGLSVDGKFGPMTETKVKEWQSAHGLIPDGVVGDITWGKMFPPLHDAKPISDLNLNALIGVIKPEILHELAEIAEMFHINNVLRLAHFLSQCSHESGKFSVVQENLNYSGERLKQVFPSYFPGNLSESYSHKPEMIASRVYGSRMGNGAESTKDGYKFRGRGYIQLTGRNNYKSFSDFIGEDVVSNPDLVATKYPLASAAFFFSKNNLWEICDRGPSVETVTAVTKRINGGTNGLQDRLQYFNKYYNLLK